MCRHETVFVNVKSKPDWLFERNPLGLVPVLEYKGSVIYESAICNQFLEEEFPGSRTGTHDLMPASPYERAAMRLLVQKFEKVCMLKLERHSVERVSLPRQLIPQNSYSLDKWWVKHTVSGGQDMPRNTDSILQSMLTPPNWPFTSG